MESADAVKQQVYEQFIRFLHVYESFSDTEIDHFLSIAERERIGNFPHNITAVHVIDCIGRNEPINSTAIAGKMELSKASITKIGGKLLADGLVERMQLNDNKKESYFRLTPQGKKIFDLHERIHANEAERLNRFLGKYSAGELKIIGSFLKDYSAEMELRISGETAKR